MSVARRASRPSSPAEIARRRALAKAKSVGPESEAPETWGVDARALRLPANADIDARRGAGGRVVRARRQDVFDMLAARGRLGPQALAAVRRLEEDIAALHRTIAGSRDFAPRVDGKADPEAFSEARLRAGERIRWALDLAGSASGRLLMALCEPQTALGAGLDWRAVVERETGERLADAQGAVVRLACDNLAGAYQRLDRGAG
jgi:hypothetical protein